MKDFWNERYADKEFAYGKKPNTFFAENLAHLPVGKLLLPCEGEGRNAVYAARQGWQVHAFDFSEQSIVKGNALARENNVSFEYTLCDAWSAAYPALSFDVVALIFVHMPTHLRAILHRRVIDWLKPGGTLILEAFDPIQLAYTSGGPKDPSMLYSEQILRSDFADMEIRLLQTTTTILDEGKYHQGTAHVIRLVAAKK